MYEVIVGNLGIVYTGDDRRQATQDFDIYQLHSQSNMGSCAGESVVLMADGEPIMEFIGTNNLDDTDLLENEELAI